MRKVVLLTVAALVVTAALPALAAPKNKGTTYVAPSAVTLSVLQGVTAPGSLGDMGAGFGIVGNPSKGVIKHVGGLEIDSTLGVIEIRNFWIDPAAGTVSAEVVDLGRFDLFDLGEAAPMDGCEVTATLTFNSFASSAIVGSSAIEGLEAATACVDLP